MNETRSIFTRPTIHGPRRPIIYLATLLVVVLSLAGCGALGTASASPVPTAATTTQAPAPTTVDAATQAPAPTTADAATQAPAPTSASTSPPAALDQFSAAIRDVAQQAKPAVVQITN